MYFLCTIQKEEDNSCVMIKGHILDLPYVKGHVDTWLTSLNPTIEESVCSRKSNPSVRKNFCVRQTYKQLCL